MPRLTDKDMHNLRGEILRGDYLNEKGHLKAGAGVALGKKYGVAAASIGYHALAARKNPKAYGSTIGAASKPNTEQQTKVRVSRDELNLDEINADIDAGMDPDAIREKYGISDSLAYNLKRERREEAPVAPLNPEQCKRVIKVLTALAEIHPDKFTRLDFLGQVSKKYSSILAEII